MGRKCYHLDEAMQVQTPDGAWHYQPSIVDEDEDGHYPTGWDYGNDYAKAREAVDSLNASMGLTPIECDEIVMHSMFPGSRGKTL